MKTIRYLNSEKKFFNTQMLEVGEMMEIIETKYKGNILLRTYFGFVNLNSPDITWGEGCNLQGRKLLPGEGITLIQE